MGSIVSLTIGGMEIDWGKNNSYINHSKLFQPSDKALLSSHEYNGVVYPHYGYKRTLGQAVPRLRLYGYNEHTVERIYNEHKSYYPGYYPPMDLAFEEFAKVVSKITITPRNSQGEYCDFDLGEFAKEMLDQPEYKELHDALGTSDKDVLTFFENLDPYVQLWLLSTNPENHELPLEWHTGDIVKSGWTTELELFSSWSEAQSFLIITEGSSDTFIIKEAISYLRPDVQDFFKYIDMKEHYPFTGTGNLFNFYQGLAKIGVVNRCLVIFDNDTEGVEKYNKCLAIAAPANLLTTTLPYLIEFSDVEAIGPSGVSKADINGAAVAIECFLDLSYRCSKSPTIRWTNFNKTMEQYQGAMEDKEFYIRQFKHALTHPSGYDFTKLEKLIDHICECCASIAG